MRWNLCKTYQKRVDDPMFDEINDAQLLWYQAQINLDLKEKYEMLRDVAEHNAMFSNPEGVQQVRDARENSFETPDEDFNDMLENMFGRGLPPEDDKQEADVFEMLRQDKMTSQYSPIIDMDLDDDLDDVSFTPFE